MYKCTIKHPNLQFKAYNIICLFKICAFKFLIETRIQQYISEPGAVA